MILVALIYVFLSAQLLCELALGCDKTVSIIVTSNGELKLPLVNSVEFSTNLLGTVSWLQGSNGNNATQDTVTYNVPMSGDRDNYTVSNGMVSYVVKFQFLNDIITCRNMTLDLELRSEHTFECSPISSCNVDMDINTVTWRKSYDEITYQTLSDGNYVPLNETNLMNDTDNIELENHDNIWIFRLTDTSILSVGYYQAVDENNRVLYSFVIYCGPEHISSTSTRTVIFGGKEADDYRDVSCVFRSFPMSEVTWARDPNDDNDNTLVDQNIRFINITNDDTESDAMLARGEIDFTYTVNGGVVINDVNYDDAGKYVCTATNDYSTASESIQLRVRSPLRPLWPALGIIASFVITAVFIVGGFVVDKIRGEKELQINQDEINVAFQRQSVSSFAEDDLKPSSPQRKRGSAIELITKID